MPQVRAWEKQMTEGLTAKATAEVPAALEKVAFTPGRNKGLAEVLDCWIVNMEYSVALILSVCCFQVEPE